MKYFVISLCLFISVFSFGQDASIKGFILDEVTNQPIEFATISIFSSSDSTLISGGITELGGAFVIESPRVSSYMVVDFLSYNPKSVDLSFTSKSLDLGNVYLTPGAISIDGIEIVAEKSTSQFLLDKKVFNVGSDIATRGGSAQDVLDNVPSVSVDIEGNVSLRGSGNVRILINGKPSGLLGISGTGGLRNLQANQIEKVEVITNPSARYDAEGTAGIINIILKKDTSSGFSGSFQVTTGIPEEIGAGANINYRKGDVNFFINYGISNARRPGGGESYTEFYNGDTTNTTDILRDIERKGLNQSIRTGLDVYLPNKQSITAALSLAKEDNDNLTTLSYRDMPFVGRQAVRSEVTALNDYIERLDNEIELENKLEYSLDYNKEFDSKEHTLSGTVQYQNNEEKENSIFSNSQYIDNQRSEVLENQRANNAEQEQRYLFQLDYNRPLSNNKKLELGTRSTLRDIKNNYLVESLLNDTWTNEVNLSNDFNYNEDVHAAYAIYSDKIDKWSYQVGLRSEYSNISTLLVTSSEGYDSTYINFFPSAFLSYAVTEKDQVQVSYSRRINRPRFRELNPFFTFSDNRNFFSGNPFLRPEYTDSYEIGYLKYFENSNLNTSIYYRKTSDNINRIKRINPDNTTETKPENLGLKDEIGFEILYGLNPFKWLKLDVETNIYQAKFYGDALPEELRVNAFSYTGRLNAKVNTKSGYDFQLRTNYRGPMDTPQGRRRPITSIDLGLSKDFLSNNLTATFSVRDLLNQRKWNYERFDDNFYEDGEYQWRRRSVTLTLSYRINAKKERGQRGGNYDGGGDY